MSESTDRLILLEYTEWAANRTPDSSIDAFLAEREAEHNKRRIAEVLDVLMAAEDFDPMTGEENAQNNANILHGWLQQIDAILTSDREYVDEITLTGPQRRTFT